MISNMDYEQNESGTAKTPFGSLTQAIHSDKHDAGKEAASLLGGDNGNLILQKSQLPDITVSSTQMTAQRHAHNSHNANLGIPRTAHVA